VCLGERFSERMPIITMADMLSPFIQVIPSVQVRYFPHLIPVHNENKPVLEMANLT
jgi:hypothetical protein